MTLKESDIHPDYLKDLSVQSYGSKPKIEGIQVLDLRTISEDGGSFLEVVRLHTDGTLEDWPQYQPLQLSYTTLEPGAIKAWHLHFNQDDLWFVPPDTKILVGLVDVRDNSPSTKNQMRFILGDGRPRLLLIPRGIAHGMANLTPDKQQVLYFTNQHFDIDNPDERRLPWDHFGADFWRMTRG